MADTPPADADANAPKGSGLFGSVMKGIIGLSLGLLGFVASLIWDGYKEIAQDQTVIQDRIRMLEEDKVKWATLAAMEQQILDIRIQIEVMRQVWAYEYGRSIPTGFPKKQGKPVLTPPEELFRDVEKYKAMRQQRMPQQFK